MAKQQITVTATIEVDTDLVSTLRQQYDDTAAGTSAREAAFDRLRGLKNQALERLHGEIAAYEGIAKKQIDEIFGI